MKKYKKAALSIAFLTFLMTGGMTTGYVSADTSNDDSSISNQEERILNSFENDDYNSWKKIVSRKSKIHNIVAKYDFETFVAARKLARAGNYDGAIELAKKIEDSLKDRLGEIFI